jgi:sulfur carrier protein ThiS
VLRGEKVLVIIEFSDGSAGEAPSGRVRDILKYLHLKENSTLVMKDGLLLTHEVHIKNGEMIRVINVVSGG